MVSTQFRTKFLKSLSSNALIPFIDSITDSKELYVLVHGVTSDKTDKVSITTKLQPFFIRDGISWCAFDLRGHGESEEPFSFDYSLADLLQICHLMRDTTKKDIIVVGHSLGGAIASHCGITKSKIPPIRDFVKSVVLLSPPDVITETGLFGRIVKIANWLNRKDRLNSGLLDKLGGLMGISFKERELGWFLEESYLLNMSDGASELDTIPTTLAWGTKDRVVSQKDFESYRNKLEPPRSVYKFIGSGHRYSGFEEKVYEIIRKVPDVDTYQEINLEN